MGDEKSTVELPAPPAWAIELSTRMQESMAKVQASVESVEGRLDKMQAAVDGLIESDKSLAARVVRGETRQDEFEQWRARASERAKQPSQLDLEQSAQIAATKVAHDQLAEQVKTQGGAIASLMQKTDAQTVILERLDKLTANPTVKLFAHAVVVAFLYWLASHGIHVPQ